MPDILDIPASWYLKGAIWAARNLRKNKKLRQIVASVRDRTMLGVVTKLHLEAIHDIRRFAMNRESLPDSPVTYESLERLANSCRNVMADLLEAWPEELHCTIKLCTGTTGAKKSDWAVYTVARSTPCHRPAHFGLSHAHKIGHNSSFASISGANDRKNTWVPHTTSCFICNDLTEHSNYDCSRDDWQSYFKATAVFPMRYRKAQDEEHTIIGYLTYDTKEIGLFDHAPCIFHSWSARDQYEKALSFLSLYHIGGMLADTLACSFYPLLSNTDTKEI